MDPYRTSALALQKTLLNLRQQRDLLRAQGRLQEADRIGRTIAEVEATLRDVPGTPTLQ